MAGLDPLIRKMSGIQGKGALDLHVKNTRTRMYICTDLIRKARSPYICACCNKTITSGSLYVTRYKKFYLDNPINYQKLKLCLNCADNA